MILALVSSLSSVLMVATGPVSGDGGYDRRGVTFSIGAGAGSCAAFRCARDPLLGLARVELGYRLLHVAFLASSMVGGAAGGPTLTFDAGAGLQVFPVGRGRVDPFLGATIGYSLFVLDDKSDRQRFSRGVVRPAVGFDFYVAPDVTLGPRFDIQIPFAGKYCVGDEDRACTKIRELVDQESSNVDKRELRRAFPKVWAITARVRVVF